MLLFSITKYSVNLYKMSETDKFTRRWENAHLGMIYEWNNRKVLSRIKRKGHTDKNIDS